MIQELDEAKRLLRAMYDLLQKQEESPYILNLLDTMAPDGYGGESPGSVLMEDIALALDIEEDDE